MAQSPVEIIRQQLQRESDEQVQASARTFFKEEIRVYGVKTARVKELAKTIRREMPDDISKSAVFAYCEDLWKSGFNEEAIVACEWSFGLRKKFEPGDFTQFETWIRSYISNWAACDTFCATTGEFLLKYPEFIPRLFTWTRDENRWVKRAAAVSLIVPVRKGLYLQDALNMAELELSDPDDMVQKGYGWLLKVASGKHPKPVLDFVMQHKHRMPRTALRYAIEKMPEAWKKEAMAK